VLHPASILLSTRLSVPTRGFLESLGGAIDAALMRKLNAAVDKEKRRPEDVASEFLGRPALP
jgi:glycine betaine/choline ABC-type transport system substrate-binding protein